MTIRTMHRFIKFTSTNYKIIVVPLFAYGSICIGNHMYKKQHNTVEKINPHEEHLIHDEHFINNNHYIDCRGLDKYDVFCHLYNSSKPLGLGLLQGEYKIMNRELAKVILDHNSNIDYCKGRPIKTNFNTFPYLHSDGYDSRNGPYDSRNGPHDTMSKLIKELMDNKVISTKIPDQVSDREFIRTMKQCGSHNIPKETVPVSEHNVGTKKSNKYIGGYNFIPFTFLYPRQ